MLELENISVKRAGRLILDGVSMAAVPGEILAIVGANGAGKSTLLATLTGELKPVSGSIRLDRKPLSEWSCRQLARRRGVLSQHFEMSFGFSALEVVLLGRNPFIDGRETAHDFAIAEAALRLVDAAHLATRPYPTLSGGERQRVQFARVLAQVWQTPESGGRLLLLDEPTASLDLSHQHLTMQIAREFAAEGTAVVVIVHDLNLAALYSDRIMVLQNGQVYSLGSPAETLTQPVIRQVFGIQAFVTEHLLHRGRPLVVPSDAPIDRRHLYNEKCL
jgi:iron complex transport system ATP-binding protein